MFRWVIPVLGLVLMVGAASAVEPAELEEESEKVGYAVGYQVGGDFRRQGLSVNPEMVVKGVLEALEGVEPLMTPEEMRRALVEVQREAAAARRKQQEELAGTNLDESLAFLAENGKRAGVTTLASGLQYRVIRTGHGRAPTSEDVVTVHYRGTLIDGSEFDSSYSRGEPATFRTTDVIAGWKEALPLMREGARWELFVPPDLGYGSDGPGRIGPNSTLIFEVELVSVKPGQ